KLYMQKTFGEIGTIRGFLQLSTRLSSTYGYYKSTYDRLEFRFAKIKPLTVELVLKWSDPNFEKKADGYFEFTTEQGVEFAGIEFNMRYDFRKYEQKTSDNQHTFRFNLRYNF
ncbi:MAG: hypothetical protein ACPL6C_04200, partial [bacterium]